MPKWRTRTKGTSRQIGKKFQLQPATGTLKQKLPKVRGNPRSKRRMVYNYDRPRRIKPMLAARGTEELLDDDNYVGQRKFDGTAVIIIKNGKNVKIMTRSWKNNVAERFPKLVAAIRKFSVTKGVWHAELTFYNKKTGKEMFLTALAKPETKERFNAALEVHDVLYVNNRDVKNKYYDERLEIISSTVPKTKYARPVKTSWTTKTKTKEWDEGRKAGREGIMLKHIDGLYEEGVRSKDSLKLKKMYTEGADTADAVVVGITKGKVGKTGKRAKTFGSLILGQYDRSGKLRYIGAAGGLSDAELKDFLRRFRRIRAPNPLYDVRVRDAKFYVRPRIVVEVKYHERTKKHKLRFPDFIRERTDKRPKECKLGT